LLIVAGSKATREDSELRKLYYRMLHRREQARAKVAVACHLLAHAFIMLRDGIDYKEFRVMRTIRTKYAKLSAADNRQMVIKRCGFPAHVQPVFPEPVDMPGQVWAQPLQCR
jgi:hypothetical protein